jgi:hypothetical protein
MMTMNKIILTMTLAVLASLPALRGQVAPGGPPAMGPAFAPGIPGPAGIGQPPIPVMTPNTTIILGPNSTTAAAGSKPYQILANALTPKTRRILQAAINSVATK